MSHTPAPHPEPGQAASQTTGGARRVLQDLALIAIRLALALVLVSHAWTRYHVVGIAAEAARLQAHGVPSPTAVVWVTVIGEALGALCLAFGLLTPLVGLGMLAGNIASALVLRRHAGLDLAHDGWEYNLVLACFGLLFLVFGAGRGGLDQLFHRRPRD